MIQMPTTQLTPVGVGWGNYVIAWLLTYSGSDCRLWQHVYEKCMESELCREAMSLLPTIGYDLRRHKCVEDHEDLNDVVAPQPTNQPKHPNHPTTQNHPSSSNRLSPRNKHLLKRSKTKPLPGSFLPSSTLPTQSVGRPGQRGLARWRWVTRAPEPVGWVPSKGGPTGLARWGVGRPRASLGGGTRPIGQWGVGRPSPTERAADHPNRCGVGRQEG
jgi:hypothetical protein